METNQKPRKTTKPRHVTFMVDRRPFKKVMIFRDTQTELHHNIYIIIIRDNNQGHKPHPLSGRESHHVAFSLSSSSSRVGNENQHLFTFLSRLINITTTSKSPANDFSCLYSSPPSPFHIPHIPEITHSVLKHQTLHQKCTVCSKSKHKMIYTSLEQY